MKRLFLLTMIIFWVCAILAQTDYLPWGPEKTFRQADDFAWITDTKLDNSIVYVWAEVSGSRNNIYAQMRAANGNSIWGAQPIAICDNILNKEEPTVITTSDNCFIVSWYGYELNNWAPVVYLQKINAQGQILWAADGIPVSDQQGYVFNLRLIPDNNGGVYFASYSLVNGIHGIKAQHISSSGTYLWDPQGALIVSNVSQVDNFEICKNIANGITVVYQTGSSTEKQIKASALNPEADYIYQDQIISNYASLKGNLTVSQDNTGGFYAAWLDERYTRGVYVQRVNQLGQPIFPEDVFVNSVNSQLEGLSVLVDSQNNAFLVTDKDNSSVLEYLHECSKIDSTGFVIFSELNLFNYPATSQTTSSILIDDMLYAACTIQATTQFGYESNIALQKVNSTGNLQFSDLGLNIQTISNYGNYKVSLKNISSDLIFSWMQIVDEKSGLMFKSTNSGGNAISPLLILKESTNISESKIVSLIGYPDYCFPIWGEIKYGSYQKWYFKKVDSQGNMNTQEIGTLINTDHSNYTPRITKNASGGFTVFGLFSETEPNSNLYAKHYDSEGNNIWGEPGKLISTNASTMLSTLVINEFEVYTIIYVSIETTPDFSVSLRAQKIINGQSALGWNGHVILNNINMSTRVIGFKNNILLVGTPDDLGQYVFKIYKVTSTMDLDPSWPAEGYEITHSYWENPPYFQKTEQGILIVSKCYNDPENNVVVQLVDNSGNLVFPEDGAHINVNVSHLQDFNWNNGLEVYGYEDTELKVFKYSINGNQITPLWNGQSTQVFSNVCHYYTTPKIQNKGNYTTIFGGYSDNPVSSEVGILNFNVIDQQGNALGGDSGLEISSSGEICRSLNLAPTTDNATWLAWSDSRFGNDIFYNLKIQKVDMQPIGTDNPVNAPAAFKLNNNYPNPFNPETTISFSLPTKAKVELSVYNIKGQKVTNLVNETMPAGKHAVTWKGMNSANKPVSSGVYFYKMTANGKSQIRKMLLMK